MATAAVPELPAVTAVIATVPRRSVRFARTPAAAGIFSWDGWADAAGQQTVVVCITRRQAREREQRKETIRHSL